MVFDPEPVVLADPGSIGLRHEALTLEAADGKAIRAWLVPATEPRRGMVLYSHGNAGNLGTQLPAIDALVSLGLDVLVYDYHGFGESEGRPSERATYLDARAAWDFATGTARVPPEQIVLWGRSLGGAVTVWLAAQPDVRPAGVVLESTYTSLVDVAEHLYPRLPVRAFSIYRYPSLERIPDLRAPLLHAHSDDDEIVPAELGRRLFAAAPEPKRFVELTGIHRRARLTDPIHRADVLAFLDEVLPRGRASSSGT
jgi:hypothetical protein